jgi:tetratricopeptide (TPR) repeat protein
VGEEDSTKEPLQLRKFINNAAALIGICVAAVAVFRFYESRKPEVVVPALAREYLESLRKGHYAQAYALFSPEAKKNCTESQLRSAFESTPWTWSNLNIVRREPDAFIFSYDKSLSGTRAQKEYLLLTQIGDQWEIPYNSSLIQAIEKSFNKADVDTGLAYAQIAKNVNPRDPIAWGYLCEAAYAKKLNSKIESYCLKALELANIYPSNLSPKSLLHLHAVMADTYHRKLNQPENAVQQYAALLAYPHLSREDQCQILLIRSQIYSDMSRPGEALNDLQRGATLCSAKKDVIFIQQMRENLHAPMPQ